MFECVPEMECEYRVLNDKYQLTECYSKCPSNFAFYYEYEGYTQCTSKCKEDIYYEM